MSALVEVGLDMISGVGISIGRTLVGVGAMSLQSMLGVCCAMQPS